jgi:hypothetical protein
MNSTGNTWKLCQNSIPVDLKTKSGFKMSIIAHLVVGWQPGNLISHFLKLMIKCLTSN